MSIDCGKCPSVYPRVASASSSCRPPIPACAVTVSAASSIATTWSIDRVSSAIAPATASAPPDTPLPPPNGTTGVRLADAQRSTAPTCSAVRGRTTATGSVAESPRRSRNSARVHQSCACASRSCVSVDTAPSGSSARSSSILPLIGRNSRGGPAGCSTRYSAPL